MADDNPEVRTGAQPTCFPVSEEASSLMFEFFRSGDSPKAKHSEALAEMLEENPVIYDSIIHWGRSWNLEGEMDIGFTSGFVMSYKMLRFQAELNKAPIPRAGLTLANTLIEDVKQPGSTTAGPYLEKRTEELKIEDPVFMRTVLTFVSALDQTGQSDRAYFYAFGAVLAYDTVRKQAYKEELDELFRQD